VAGPAAEGAASICGGGRLAMVGDGHQPGRSRQARSAVHCPIPADRLDLSDHELAPDCGGCASRHRDHWPGDWSCYLTETSDRHGV